MDRPAGALCHIDRQPDQNRKLSRNIRPQRVPALSHVGVLFGCRGFSDLRHRGNDPFCHAEAGRVVGKPAGSHRVDFVDPAGTDSLNLRIFRTDLVPGKVAQPEAGCPFKSAACIRRNGNGLMKSQPVAGCLTSFVLICIPPLDRVIFSCSQSLNLEL